MASLIGYARVSSTDQSTAIQVARLKEAGCQVIRRESASGRKRDGRTELATILDFIRPGDTKGPVGKMVLTVLGMVAEMEVGFIRERQRAGIEAAKARGVYKGRPVTLDHAKIVDLHRKGNGATAIARAVGCSRGAIYKVLGQSVSTPG
jgi:DNA invertase Pin-like site-specific DNA recombinase